MRKIGKKGLAWQRERRQRIKELKTDERYVVEGERVYGTCLDCGHWHQLTPDHKIKRSAGGGHEAANIDWVCNEPPCFCHSKRDNMGDPNNKKPKDSGKGKKPNWMKDHKCKNCKAVISTLLCGHCGKVSV